MTSPNVWPRVRVTIVALFFQLVIGSALAAEAAKEVSFDIASGAALKTLKEFSAQSGQSLLYANADLAGVVTNEVKGRFSIGDALDRLLLGTPLAASRDSKNGAVAVGRTGTEKSDPNVLRAAQVEKSDRPTDRSKADGDEKVAQLPVFEVMAGKVLNMDIPRDRDGPQPYTIFSREKIAQSGALNIEDFLKNRLTMNTVAVTASQVSGTAQNNSSFNLRGLGTNQTLILVDGRRAPTYFGIVGGVGQPDLNGIPLSAVERIEVLPTTASGIYGGGATGGAINIIMRKNYSGAESRLSYENSFDRDAGTRQADLSVGFNLEDGKTNIFLSGSYAERSGLALGDRGYFNTYSKRFITNAGYQAIFGTTPPLGATPNIRSADGSNLVLKKGQTLNSSITFVPPGYAGAQSDGGNALAANAGQYNLDLGQGAQTSYLFVRNR